MSVTIKDTMSLIPFKNSVLLAGKEGLNNVIQQISISDTPLSDADYTTAKAGDFIISSFYFAKNDIKTMYKFIDVLLETKSSGLCLTDEYIKELPPEICNYCNDNMYPVIMVGMDVLYADIIFSVMELIILDQQKQISENKINFLLNSKIDEGQKLSILDDLNPHIKNNILCAYINDISEESLRTYNAKKEFIDYIDRDILSLAANYKKGVIVITSFTDTSKDSLLSKSKYICEHAGDFFKNVTIGFSTVHNSKSKCSEAINEAISASTFSFDEIYYSDEDTGSIHRIFYDDLGVSKLLMSLKRSQELNEFCREFIDPIKDFDDEHNSNLLATIRIFIKTDCSYKQTADYFFTHENTIRYRVNKVRELVAKNMGYQDFLTAVTVGLKGKDIEDRG